MKRLVVPVLLAFGATQLAARTAPPLTLDDCLKLAVDKHPALAAAQAGVSAANESVGEARAPYYPTLDLNTGYHRFQRRLYLPTDVFPPSIHVPPTIGPLDDWNAGLATHVTLYDFGSRRAGLDAARARLAGAEVDAGGTRSDVAHAVRIAYYGLAAALDLQIATNNNVARAESHLGLAQVRRQAGAVPQVDVFRAEAEVASARLLLIDTQSRVRVTMGRLNTAMGRSAETPLNIDRAIPALPPPAVGELDVLAARAAKSRSAIRSGERRIEAARATVTAARAASTPKLRADGSLGLRDNTWMPETREWQVGLSIDVPLFDAGSRARRLARSKAELAREEAAVEQRRLQVREEVWSAAVELERSWASITANEAAVRAGTESLRLVRERYQNGAAVITDLLDTQTVLARAEAALAAARWDYLVARASFERAVGTAP